MAANKAVSHMGKVTGAERPIQQADAWQQTPPRNGQVICAGGNVGYLVRVLSRFLSRVFTPESDWPSRQKGENMTLLIVLAVAYMGVHVSN